MIRKSLRNNRAVTLTELLVVLAIIALLATIAVPVYINQMQRARIAAAQLETRQIAEAMQAAAITHGFLVPIHVLDNIPNRDSSSSGGGGSATLDNFDNMSDRSSNNIIDISRPLISQSGVGNQLDLDSSDARVVRMIEGWQGPFLNPKRVRYEGENLASGNTGDLTKDLVVDPWGNPYRVYSDFGLLSSRGIPSATNENVLVTMDDMALSTGGQEDDRFDRFAIVSYGPDGLTGFTTALQQGDDIYYTFSINPGNESKYQFY